MGGGERNTKPVRRIRRVVRGIDEQTLDLICSTAKALGKKVDELTVYEIMSIGFSYHYSSIIRVLAKQGKIKCDERGY